MRQIVLDTETTGLELTKGHRIIEIGCVEIVNRRHTGRHFHQYLNPEREIDAGAIAVHGLLRERLASAPRFGEVASALLEFIGGSELIIHNAAFDLAFLDMELELLSRSSAPLTGALPASVRTICSVLDTLLLARERHPGQRNNLDALCRRYGIDASHRELHGALLDAQLLADVYLAMTGGQSVLAFDDGAATREGALAAASALETAVPLLLDLPQPLRVIRASDEELAAHARLTALLQQASGGRCLWARWQEAAAESACEGAIESVAAAASSQADPAELMPPAVLEIPPPAFAAGMA